MPDREDEVLVNELIDAHAAATGRPTDLGLTTWAGRRPARRASWSQLTTARGPFPPPGVAAGRPEPPCRRRAAPPPRGSRRRVGGVPGRRG